MWVFFLSHLRVGLSSTSGWLPPPPYVGYLHHRVALLHFPVWIFSTSVWRVFTSFVRVFSTHFFRGFLLTFCSSLNLNPISAFTNLSFYPLNFTLAVFSGLPGFGVDTWCLFLLFFGCFTEVGLSLKLDNSHLAFWRRFYLLLRGSSVLALYGGLLHVSWVLVAGIALCLMGCSAFCGFWLSATSEWVGIPFVWESFSNI